MNTRAFLLMIGFGVTSAVTGACAAERTLVPATPPPEAKKPQSSKAPVQPAPAESRTPEEASKRAADPKDPSGALIVAPPAGAGAAPAR
jgi:hypothetical protein